MQQHKLNTKSNLLRTGNFYGKKGRSIVEVDINKLLELLNKAYADEWIAYYAYKWASKVATGIISPHVAQLAGKIADEEKEHADELAERILES